MFKNSEYNIHPELIINEPVETRLAHAKNVDSSPELLEVLTKDKFWYVRYFVAFNPGAPNECLEILCEDSDFRVRDVAKSGLYMRGAFCKPALDDALKAAMHIAQNKPINNKLVSNEISKDIDI